MTSAWEDTKANSTRSPRLSVRTLVLELSPPVWLLSYKMEMEAQVINGHHQSQYLLFGENTIKATGKSHVELVVPLSDTPLQRNRYYEWIFENGPLQKSN